MCARAPSFIASKRHSRTVLCFVSLGTKISHTPWKDTVAQLCWIAPHETCIEQYYDLIGLHCNVKITTVTCSCTIIINYCTVTINTNINIILIIKFILCNAQPLHSVERSFSSPTEHSGRQDSLPSNLQATFQMKTVSGKLARIRTGELQ